MKRINQFTVLIFLLMLLGSCKRKEAVSDLETLRNNTNNKSYPAKQMDSTQAINSITKQKVQELLDLSLLYTNGKKNTSIDTVIFNQMKSYFYKPDSTTFKELFEDLENKNVKNAKVKDLQVSKKIINKKDTLDFANFSVEYIDKTNKSLGNFERNAQYILVTPNKESKEFKFYLLNFYRDSLKEKTSSGVTK